MKLMRLLLIAFSLLLCGCTSQAQPEKRKEETKDKPVVKIEIIRPPLPPQNLRNAWPQAWEEEFQKRAAYAIGQMAGKGYGGTYFENEKRAYAIAMMDFLAGNRKKAVDFLQGEDANAKEWNSHTLGIDLFPSFTLKHQMRKYFLFGEFLDADYKKRMFEAAKIWTEQDPLNRPHPNFKGQKGEGWTPFFKNSWVDVRGTDNLRFMRDTAVYLMAEESGNTATKGLYKSKLNEHVQAMYNIGMGEWDSENYLGHSLAPWLNVYDFAKDEEVRGLAKAALDWVCTAAALKYYKGALNGPTKRDYYHPVPLEAAANQFALYFGDYVGALKQIEPDYIHSITSNYRPPQAVMELARKNFQRPVTMFLSHPTYEHWKPGAAEKPEFYETQHIGNTFLLGSLPTGNPAGIWDVNGLKMLVANSQRGADYFIPASGNAPEKITTSTNGKDHIAQFGPLLLHLNGEGNAPFHFFVPPDTKVEQKNDIWFFQMEKTWVAVHPLNLSWSGENAVTTKVRERAPGVTIYSAQGKGDKFCGYALEVGEAPQYVSHENFRDAVLQKAKVETVDLTVGSAVLHGANGHAMRLQAVPGGMPQIWRDGQAHDWAKHFALYQGANGAAPVEQGWKSGTFKVLAGGKTFSGKLSLDGKYSFTGTN
jgi:hypothetical protein